MVEPYDPDLLLAFIEDELTEAQRAQVQQLFEQQPELRALTQAMRSDRDALRSLPSETAPQHVMEGVNELLERQLLLNGPGPSAHHPQPRATPSHRIAQAISYIGLAALIALAASVVILTLTADGPNAQVALTPPDSDTFATANAPRAQDSKDNSRPTDQESKAKNAESEAKATIHRNGFDPSELSSKNAAMPSTLAAARNTNNAREAIGRVGQSALHSKLADTSTATPQTHRSEATDEQAAHANQQITLAETPSNENVARQNRKTTDDSIADTTLLIASSGIAPHNETHIKSAESAQRETLDLLDPTTLGDTLFKQALALAQLPDAPHTPKASGFAFHQTDADSSGPLTQPIAAKQAHAPQPARTEAQTLATPMAAATAVAASKIQTALELPRDQQMVLNIRTANLEQARVGLDNWAGNNQVRFIRNKAPVSKNSYFSDGHFSNEPSNHSTDATPAGRIKAEPTQTVLVLQSEQVPQLVAYLNTYTAQRAELTPTDKPIKLEVQADRAQRLRVARVATNNYLAEQLPRGSRIQAYALPQESSELSSDVNQRSTKQDAFDIQAKKTDAVIRESAKRTTTSQPAPSADDSSMARQFQAAETNPASGAALAPTATSSAGVPSDAAAATVPQEDWIIDEQTVLLPVVFELVSIPAPAATISEPLPADAPADKILPQNDVREITPPPRP